MFAINYNYGTGRRKRSPNSRLLTLLKSRPPRAKEKYRVGVHFNNNNKYYVFQQTAVFQGSSSSGLFGVFPLVGRREQRGYVYISLKSCPTATNDSLFSKSSSWEPIAGPWWLGPLQKGSLACFSWSFLLLCWHDSSTARVLIFPTTLANTQTHTPLRVLSNLSAWRTWLDGHEMKFLMMVLSAFSACYCIQEKRRKKKHSSSVRNMRFVPMLADDALFSLHCCIPSRETECNGTLSDVC